MKFIYLYKTIRDHKIMETNKHEKVDGDDDNNNERRMIPLFILKKTIDSNLVSIISLSFNFHFKLQYIYVCAFQKQ